MRITARDRRALVLLGGAGALWLVLVLAGGGDGPPAAVGLAEPIPAAERRLARMREQAATVPGQEQILQRVTADLAAREQGILQAQTAAQAQAQMLEVVRRVARAQAPPIDFGTVELTQEVRRLGDYGEVELSVPFTCRIEELLNFLADLTKQREAIATSEIRISAQDPKEKTITVRLTVSGVVPKRLVPEKKGLAAF